MRVMLKSKVHRAHVSNANIDYEGSITIDSRIMEAADILPYERVEVLNINTGARFDTYAIEGEKGEICLNGAAARLGTKGDTVILLTYCYVDDKEVHSIIPTLVYVDEKNAIVKTKRLVGTTTL